MKRTPVRSEDDFLVFGSPDIKESDIEEVVATLRSGWIGTWPKVFTFEQEFAKYKSAPYAVAVNSCTAALHLSLIAADLPPGSEVITTPLTFCATVNAILHAGYTPVLVDVDPDTMNIDPGAIAAAVTDKTAGIVPVHFAGRPCAMDRIVSIAEKYGLTIIEDCAHAVESTFHGTSTGTFGDFGCFSFYVTKNMTTGEGGMVLVRDPEKAARIKRLALHGMSADAWDRYGDEGYKHYFVVEKGFKYNMMDIQAAIGLHQLARLPVNLKKREKIWKRYTEAFSNLPIQIPSIGGSDELHSRHLYTVRMNKEASGISRDEFLVKMTEENIGVGVHYVSLPEHPFYSRTLGWKPEQYPVATMIGRETVSLPLSAKMTNRDVDDVITAVCRVVEDTI